MTAIERITQQLEQMPNDMLMEAEACINRLMKSRQRRPTRTCLLEDLAAMAQSDDLPSDLSMHHDHYIYGVQK